MVVVWGVAAGSSRSYDVKWRGYARQVVGVGTSLSLFGGNPTVIHLFFFPWAGDLILNANHALFTSHRNAILKRCDEPERCQGKEHTYTAALPAATKNYMQTRKSYSTGANTHTHTRSPGTSVHDLLYLRTTFLVWSVLGRCAACSSTTHTTTTTGILLRITILG